QLKIKLINPQIIDHCAIDVGWRKVVRWHVDDAKWRRASRSRGCAASLLGDLVCDYSKILSATL
ncbi:MAG: hypothetical protein ACJ8FZ_11400, partial [Bradyrhizobium sp.]